MKPQTVAVLRLLREHPEGVTPIDAWKAGCGLRLAARTWELEQFGYVITKKHAGRGIWIYQLTETKAAA